MPVRALPLLVVAISLVAVKDSSVWELDVDAAG
jgi:hypothetical protein